MNLPDSFNIATFTAALLPAPVAPARGIISEFPVNDLSGLRDEQHLVRDR